MDDYWRGYPVPGPGNTTVEAESVWPILKANLDAFKADAESKSAMRSAYGTHAARMRWVSVPHAQPMPKMPDTDTEEETEKKMTPLPPQGGKRKRSKESLFVIDQEGDEAMKHWYSFCVKNYPTKDKGNNRAKNAYEERTINRDSVQAQANFKAILDSGKATARELASCVDVASQRWAKDLGYEYQFIPNLSTYFGPEKSLWLNDLAAARRQLEQIDQKEATT